jgi:hypothetical protein
MLLSAAVLLGVAVVACTWLYQNVILVLKRLHATKDIPDPAGGHRLLGHLLLLLAKPMTSFRVFHEWAKTYGPVYRVRFLWRPVSSLCSLCSSGSIVRRAIAADTCAAASMHGIPT